MCHRDVSDLGNWESLTDHSSAEQEEEQAQSLQNTFLTSSLIAVSFPVSEPTNSSSCSTVSAAEFLKPEIQQKHFRIFIYINKNLNINKYM